jgi:hypothetical protein
MPRRGIEGRLEVHEKWSDEDRSDAGDAHGTGESVQTEVECFAMKGEGTEPHTIHRRFGTHEMWGG